MSKKKKKKNKAIQIKAVPVKDKNSSNRLFTIASIVIILLIGYLCFSNSLDNDFVNWDDDKNFYENTHITSLNKDNFWSNTQEIFKTHVIGNYNPLSTWSFLLNNYFNGLDNPFPWHLTNLILHLLCVILVFRICLMLKLNWQGSAVVALLFAIHPMRVESVAWVTERKDVLFGFFYLMALFYYIRSRNRNKNIYIVPIIFFFVLSLLSKIQAVALPLSMICIDYYLDEQFSLKRILNKSFYFVLSILTGLAGIYFLGQQGSLGTDVDFSFFQRIFIGSYSYLVYIVKAVIPYKLSPLYPYPNTFPIWLYPTILSFISAAIFLVIGYKKKWKVAVFGLLFFSVNIVFMLQILGAGQGYLADRFTYIAYLGLFFIIGYYSQLLFKNPKLRYPSVIVLCLYMGFLGWTTFNQNKIWKNSATLWTHVLQYHTNTTLPYGNRANYYRDLGQTQKALDDYSASIALKNTDAAPFNSRAKLYFNSNKPSDWNLALNDYNNAIRIDPKEGEYYVNRGAIYAKMGKLNEAIQDFNTGLALKPDHDVGYLNRSILFNMTGDLASALKDIQSYLVLKPHTADLWYESALCKRRLSYQPAEILSDLNKAIKYNNAKDLFYLERSKVYHEIGQRAQSKKDFQKAKQLGAKPSPELEAILNG